MTEEELEYQKQLTKLNDVLFVLQKSLGHMSEVLALVQKQIQNLNKEEIGKSR